jgi:hypothetical protein
VRIFPTPLPYRLRPTPIACGGEVGDQTIGTDQVTRPVLTVRTFRVISGPIPRGSPSAMQSGVGGVHWRNPHRLILYLSSYNSRFGLWHRGYGQSRQRGLAGLMVTPAMAQDKPAEPSILV